MESQQQHYHQEDINNGGAKISPSSSYLCRQSSSRWTPTTEQIKLLKDLYYINGVRSPAADQIQSICARLRRYGKIEGKNVFYWFQNHKARERQKKRLIPNANSILPAATNQYQNENNNNIIRNGNFQWKQDQDFSLHNKYPSSNNPGFSCSSSTVGVVPGGGQLMGNFGYGAITLENTFRECSITGGGILNGGNVNHNSQWPVGNYTPYVHPTYYSNFLDKISSIDEDHDYEQDDHDDEAPEIETLPLFPTHDDDHNHNQGFYTIKPGSEACYTGSYRCSNGNNGSASLELSLNSYGYTQYL